VNRKKQRITDVKSSDLSSSDDKLRQEMKIYYSQNGEDFLIDLLFDDKETGFFVEVGCIDGRRFSNTLILEERGWKGLCVEAHKDYIELLRRNRPNSIISPCAVGEKDDESVPFFANARGSLSTLDRSRENQFQRVYGVNFSGFVEQDVQMRRLDTLFREFGIKNIDILSLDIEGYEIQALQGIDFSIYKPDVMLIESDSPQHEQQLDEILEPYGYIKSVKVSKNIFYLLNPVLVKRIQNKNFRVSLTHTQHPLDDGGDIKKVVYVNTFPKYSLLHNFYRFQNKLSQLLWNFFGDSR
jgi:FkbM family methyltransferase